jgi:hypothetical protein
LSHARDGFTLSCVKQFESDPSTNPARPPMIRCQLALTAVVVLSLVRPAGAADAKYVKLVHVETGKVLGVTDDSEEAGAKAVLAKDEANPARQWKLEKDGEQYKIVNRKTGKVLDVFEASKDEGGTIIVWDEKTDDNANQRWAWQGDGAERRLKSRHSDLVLAPDADGHVLQKKADDKARNQLWRVVDVKE